MAGLTALAGASVAAQLAVSSFGGILSGARGVGTALAGFGSSLANGNTAFTSLNGVVGALGSALGKIPLIGGGFEAVAQGTSFLITQIEKTITDFKDLSKVGALTAKGMTGVQEQFLMSGQTMAGFKKNVIDFAPALAQFKGDVGAGANEFAKISGELLSSDLGKELKLLTGDVDLIGEGIADFVKLQTQLGLAQKKDYKQLAQGAGEYAKNMDLLSRQTGLARKDLQSARDAAMNESRYRAAIETMRAGSEEDNRKADILDSVQLIVGATNKEFSQAIRDAAGGFNNTEAVKKFIVAGADPSSVIEDIKSGVIKTSQEAVDRLKEMAVAAEGFVKQQAPVRPTGDSKLPDYAPLLAFIRSSTKEAGAQAAAAQKDLAKGTDELTNNVVAAQEALLQASRNISNFGFALMPTATGAIAEFTKVLSDSVTRIAKELNINLPKIGGSNTPSPAPTPAASAAAAVTTASGKARTAWNAEENAAEKEKVDKATLAALKAAGASAAEIKTAEERLAKSTKERADAEVIARKADEDAASARKEQAKYEKLSTASYIKNYLHSRWMGEQTVTDEKTKLSFTIDEVKLAEKDRDNYERFIKRKDELLDAELANFKTKNKRKANSKEESDIEELTRNQARKEFLPAATAVGAARTIRPVMQPGDLEAPTKPSIYAGADAWAKYRAADKKFTEESKQKRSAPATPQTPAATVPATPKTADYTPPAAGTQTSPRGTQPQTPTASLTGKSPLAELVARGESDGDYNAARSGGRKKQYKAGEKKLTEMTIGEVQDAQSKGEMAAAGRYEVIPTTMKLAVSSLGLNSTDKFDEAMQDRIFNEYLTNIKRPEIQSFLSGNQTADIDAAVLSLAQEFASIGVPAAMKRPANPNEGIPARDLQAGEGYYSGVGNNPAGPARVTPDQARAALTQTRDQMKASVAGPEQKKMAQGGVINGPTSVLAGENPAMPHEAFVPLPDGKRIPVKQDTTVVKDVQNLSAQVSGLSKLLAGKMITQTGATDNDQGMGIKTSTIITKLLKTAFPVLGQIEKIGGIGNTVAGVADTDSKMSGFDKFLEVAKMLSPQIRVLSGIYDTVKPFLQSDDNTATLAKRQMPVAPDLSAAMTDLGNLASTNTPNLGEIASPSIDRADVTSNNIGKLIDELKEQNKSNMKDAMSSVAGELKDAFKGMTPQSQDNSASQELVAAVNEMVRTQRDTNAISSRILQVSQN
jgi:hypothetical protein